MFIDCNVTIIPTVGNIREITWTAAKFVFVQKLFFALTKIRKGLGSFWDEFSMAQLICWWTFINEQLQTVWAISIFMKQYRQQKKK